jgi:hypothetical protein
MEILTFTFKVIVLILQMEGYILYQESGQFIDQGISSHRGNHPLLFTVHSCEKMFPILM